MLLLALLAATPAAAQVSFIAPQQTGAPQQRLIYVNNPQELTESDLADREFGANSLFTLQSQGSFRAAYLHQSRVSFAINYRISVRNPSADQTVYVTVFGSGEAADKQSTHLLQLLRTANTTGTTVAIPPGESRYIFQTGAPATPDRFLQGCVDFTITGGSAWIDFLAARDFSTVDPVNTVYVGYVTRGGPESLDEGRHYKGVADSAVVVGATLGVNVGSKFRGAVSFSTLTYSVSNRRYNSPSSSDGFWTNVGPAENSGAGTTDMLPLAMPGYTPPIDVTQPTDARDDYAALYNSAVVYQMAGYVSNSASKSKTVAFAMRPKINVDVVVKINDNDWDIVNLEGDQAYEYFVDEFAPGVTPFLIQFVADDAAGGLLHSVDVCCQVSELSIGWILVIVVFCAIPVYVGVGFAINRFRFGLSGVDALPHIAFWRDLPYLVRDGCRFVYAKLTFTEFQPSDSGAGSAYASVGGDATYGSYQADPTATPAAPAAGATI